MIRKIGAVVGAALSLAVFGAPADAAVSPTNTSVGAPLTERVVNQPRNGAHIVLSRNSGVGIRMSVCGTCGYSLALTTKPNAAVARYDGSASAGSTCSSSPCVGGSERRDFEFVATGYGQTTIRFTLRGPGSSGSVQHITYYLDVLRHARIAANGKTHLVRSGDTLFRIARAALGTTRTTAGVSTLVGRIYRDNRETIGRNPSLLIPGELLLVDTTGITA